VAGAVESVIFPVEDGELVPHELLAVTDTVPTAEPIVIVADVVPCPAVIDHPVPVTDHV
jgi:hypothetical protein